MSPLFEESWDKQMRAMISTWKMSFDGLKEAIAMDQVEEAVQHAVMCVENEPSYTSVGYGGLPAKDGTVLLDAAWMDGQNLRFGAIMATEGIQNPVRAARLLCGRSTNCLLAGRGAERFAIEAGLPMRDMRTPESQQQWRDALKDQKDQQPLDAYRDHDTVCVLGLDDTGHMIAATSTSGLFMKEPGRVGDSPIIGSGFYCDSRYGAAAATGLGEDIMRGCLSYEIVSLMKRGLSPKEACEEALLALSEQKIALGEDEGSMSVIALSPTGEFGAATTLDIFPFAAGQDGEAKLYVARCNRGETTAAKSSDVENIP